MVDKQQNKAVVTDVAIQSDSDIKKKEDQKLDKHCGLEEELEKMWRVKATVLPVVIDPS